MNENEVVSLVMPLLVLVGASVTVCCCIPLTIWYYRRRNPTSRIETNVPGSAGGAVSRDGSLSGSSPADAAPGGAHSTISP
jgi:hypothetical protein